MAVEERTDPIRVVLVEDHDFYRSGLKEMLREEGIQVVGDVARAEDGVALIRHSRPDVVLMDIHMEGLSGIEATRRVREASPGTQVVMLTISHDDEDVLDALAAGASGYLVKGASIGEVVEGIRKVAAGESLLSPAVTGHVIARVREGAAAQGGEGPAEELSRRELDVLELIGAGLDNAQIAERLHLSPTTVKHHVSSVLEKLGVENRVQAAVYAVRQGLV